MIPDGWYTKYEPQHQFRAARPPLSPLTCHWCNAVEDHAIHLNWKDTEPSYASPELRPLLAD